MKHPHSSQVLSVINNFLKVLPLAKKEGHLNMAEYRVQSKDGCSLGGSHTCGTVHCHAGWYAIANKEKIGFTHKDGYVGFDKGYNVMCADLGFKYDKGLRLWADQNPEIWGNDSGERMFYSAGAFIHPIKRPNGALNLQHIIDHWQEVYERLLILEGKEVPKIAPLIEQPKTITKYVAVKIDNSILENVLIVNS